MVEMPLNAARMAVKARALRSAIKPFDDNVPPTLGILDLGPPLCVRPIHPGPGRGREEAEKRTGVRGEVRRRTAESKQARVSGGE